MSVPTMSDVARAAGVHQTTVSLALRNHRSIPEVTRERIRRVAQEMGYRPNPMVSALIAERKKRRPATHGCTLAFLTAFPGPGPGAWRASANYRTVSLQMERRARQLGYRLEEFWLREPGMTPGRLREILINRGIRGIIVCPLPREETTIEFDFSDFSAVALGLTLVSPRLDHVAINYPVVMNLAVEALRRSGHRRIGLALSARMDLRLRHLSLGAFLALRQHDPRHFAPPLCQRLFTAEAILAWVGRSRPDAILTATRREYDFVAETLRESGARLPEEHSIASLDCREGSDEGGIAQDLEAEAVAAVDLVTSLVERAQFGIPRHPRTVLVDGYWREGALVRS